MTDMRLFVGSVFAERACGLVGREIVIRRLGQRAWTIVLRDKCSGAEFGLAAPDRPDRPLRYVSRTLCVVAALTLPGADRLHFEGRKAAGEI